MTENTERETSKKRAIRPRSDARQPAGQRALNADRVRQNDRRDDKAQHRAAWCLIVALVSWLPGKMGRHQLTDRLGFATRAVASQCSPNRMSLRPMLTSTENVHDAQILAQAIVNTIPEPFLVLDEQFHVLAASRSFYETFKVDPEQTRGCLLYALGDGQWDIPSLRVLLETIIPERTSMDGFEVEHDFRVLAARRCS